MAQNGPKWIGILLDGVKRIVSIDKMFTQIDHRIQKSIAQFQRKVVQAIVDSLIFIGSLILLIAGVLMVLSKYIPLEYLFIGIGFIGLVIWLVRHVKVGVR